MRISVVLLGLLLASAASADRTIPSVMFVSKSENRNQVRYSVQLDDRCGFASRAPVRAYWQMLEKGPSVTEPLLDREESAYGIARQQVVGTSVVVWLRALPSRQIMIRVSRAADGTCSASAETTIAGRQARLESIYVALAFLHVDHMTLQGQSPDGRNVSERIDP